MTQKAVCLGHGGAAITKSLSVGVFCMKLDKRLSVSSGFELIVYRSGPDFIFFKFVENPAPKWKWYAPKWSCIGLCRPMQTGPPNPSNINRIINGMSSL